MGFWSQFKTRDIDGIEGLVTVVVQDSETDEVLMVAYANEEAILKTLESGLAHYYSTSREKLWLKGETSGNTQKIVEILVDCDQDALIYKVMQKGAACHTGARSCFYRRLSEGQILEIEG